MKPIFVLHQDKVDGQYFLTTRMITEKLIIPHQFTFIREFLSLSLALMELNRLQKIYDNSIPGFLLKQAS